MVAVAAQSQAFVAGKVAARQPRQRVVRVAAVQQEAAAAPLRFLAAGLAAAAVVVSSPAQAGVVLTQPEVKNFVTGETPAPKAAAAKASKPAAAAAKKEEGGAPGAGFEAFRPLVLPLSLLTVGGAGAAWYKSDPEFARLLDGTWSAKDSIATGAGYETAPGLKDGPFFGGSGAVAVKAAPKKAGTTKKAAGTSGTAKKSIKGIFGGKN